MLGHFGCLDLEPRSLSDPRLPPLRILAALVVRLLERRRLQRLLAHTECSEGPPQEAAAPQLLQREQITQMLECSFRLGLRSG